MRNRLLAVSLLLSLAACSRPHAQRQPLPADEARALLINRNWIDVMPQSVHDKLHVFRFVPNMGGGVYQDRTIFAGSFELFQFRSDGRTLDFDLLHTGERARTTITIERITPSRPGDFDLKLTLDKSPRGPGVYYGWQKESGATAAVLDADLAALAPR
jgi:hypothetical protein